MIELTTLIERAQRGDHQAYGQIVRRFQDMVVGFCYAKVGAVTLAEDLTQEAFLKAYLSLGDLREPAAFPGWFQKILLTQIGRFKQKRQLPTVPLEYATRQFVTQETPQESVERQERQERIHRAIAALPPAQAEVVMLYYMGDYSQQEISAFLDVPRSTVKMRLYHARNSLAERMIDMVQADLHAQRPSNDERFTDQVMGFLQAICRGDLPQTEALLQADPKLLTARGVIGASKRARDPFAHALVSGQQEIAAYLLAQGVDINAQSADGLSPVHEALSAQQSEMARWLVDQGAAVDVWAAALLGDLPRVQALVEADPTLVHARWAVGATLLHLATTVPLAEYLLTQGADLQARDDHVQLTPLGWHAVMHQTELVEFLVTQGCKAENIFVACAIGDLVQVQAFLATDPALLQAKDPDRNHSPLHYAALAGHCSVAQVLLEQGADVNAGVAEGVLTPLFLAIQCGQAAMVELLIAAGADLAIQEPYHHSSLFTWAQRYGNAAIRAQLAEAGVMG